MKNVTKTLIPATATIALAVAGCQQGRGKEGDKTPVKQEAVPADTLNEDTMSDFIERMRNWEILHGGTYQTEMDK